MSPLSGSYLRLGVFLHMRTSPRWTIVTTEKHFSPCDQEKRNLFKDSTESVLVRVCL